MKGRIFLVTSEELRHLTGDAKYAYNRHWVENPVTDRWLANPLRNAIEEGTRALFSDNYTRMVNACTELKAALGRL